MPKARYSVFIEIANVLGRSNGLPLSCYCPEPTELWKGRSFLQGVSMFALGGNGCRSRVLENHFVKSKKTTMDREQYQQFHKKSFLVVF
jgi:hypothetical protein